jgi:isocitrate dehydrogenase kinase/phosphatase
VTESHPVTTTLERAVERVLEGFAPVKAFADFTGDVRRVAAVLQAEAAGHVITTLEVGRSPFFRNKGAYVIGRAHTLAGAFPVAIALVNGARGICADAVLTEVDDISIVFSFSRSAFLVETACPSALVGFLRELMPRKPIAELYSAIGHNKHGKTEFYRALLAHLESSDEQFDIAPGARGMVMVVFTMPGFDAVFKIIRDQFEPPKTATRADVREKYAFVFRHDRAGRLVDAQEFEHLKFDRRRFSPALLDELAAKTSGTVRVENHSVAFDHLYTERRLTPLDLFVRTAPPALARSAVIDYGTAIRDLAATNIFPGDLLIKNFGVSRHGRVIFYDYDELCLLSDCRFRRLPPPRDFEDELSSDPWFHVADNDIFPEEFLTFLGLSGELRDALREAHGDLLTPEFWVGMQEEHRAGRLPDIWPYPAEKRLSR